MSDDTYYYHVTSEKNDFSSWIGSVFSNENLSKELRKAHGRLESQICLLRYVLKELRKLK